MKVKYQGLVKWYIDNRRNNETTGWMSHDLQVYFDTYEECLESIKKEVKRRSRTEQPISEYKIRKVTLEKVVEVKVN